MLTRALKRRMGLRDLWDMIVNNDDICFKHILPRLDRNDIKFLYEVNSETRALIKRSSRRDDLKKRFIVGEMSSKSTFEIVWENRSLWPMDWYCEAYFCWNVAHTNKLELLRWAREEKGCDWERLTTEEAAWLGNLDMLKYCVASGCDITEEATAEAARGGQLECLKYIHEELKIPLDSLASLGAAEMGHLHILEYLVERRHDGFQVLSCYIAAENGHLECLKYLHETAKAPWDSDAVRRAYKYNHPECLQYLRDNDCPLPVGWWYDEDGTLFGEETINAAAKDGDLEKVKYCLAKNCPMNGERACAYAAQGGHLKILKYLHETAKAPWDYKTSEWAAQNGNLHILEYLVERKYDKYDSGACKWAAGNGHLNCLKFLHEVAKAPWNKYIVEFVYIADQPECLQYLLDNCCPLPEGWRYEDGELHLPEWFDSTLE